MAAAPTNVLRRLRHIHIPDLPPTYAPLWLAPQIQEYSESMIRTIGNRRVKIERKGAHPLWYDPEPNPQWIPKQVKYWLGTATPPPLVLTFTSRPVFALPPGSSSPLKDSARIPALLTVAFPEPPGWSRTTWALSDDPAESSQWVINPLKFVWDEVAVRSAPEYVGRQLAELEPPSPLAQQETGTYHGPGVLSILTSLDLYGEFDKDAIDGKIAKFQAAIERTTIAVLETEYGLVASTAADGTGRLWVDSQYANPGCKTSQATRRYIATIERYKLDRLVRFSVSINVGQPSTQMVRDERQDHEDTILGPRNGHDNQATSVVAELSDRSLRRSLGVGGPSPFVRYVISSSFDSDGHAHCPYSKLHWKAKENGIAAPAAPLGMDNYDLASAWAFGFAAQLGIDHVDQVSDRMQFEMRDISRRSKNGNLPPPARIHSILTDNVSKQARAGESDFGQDMLDTLDLQPEVRVPMWNVLWNGIHRLLEHATLGEQHAKKEDTRLLHWELERRRRVQDEHMEREGRRKRR
ncbi:unnamed protein product [Discula destructiva]